MIESKTGQACPNEESVKEMAKPVDMELVNQYLELKAEKEKLLKIEEELDGLVTEIEDQKKDIFSNPNKEYAYVTYDDLQNLPLWS